MRWLKLTLITLGAMLLLASLAIAVVVITFDEADYRDALIRLVERRTGARLTIKGSLHIAPSLTPELSAADIRLESGDPRYQLEIGKASLRLDLLPLLPRTVVIADGMYLPGTGSRLLARESTESTEKLLLLPSVGSVGSVANT